MNHPEREQWVPYLFGEATPQEARSLQDHLNHCAQCREGIESWQRSVSRLDAWKLSDPIFNPQRGVFSPVLKWAAAAAIVLGVGIGIGRLAPASPSADEVRKIIEPELREQLRQEFAVMLREELQNAESQRLADFVALKKDLDTVAVLTDAGLRRTERQLVNLAGYAQPASYSQPKD